MLAYCEISHLDCMGGSCTSHSFCTSHHDTATIHNGTVMSVPALPSLALRRLSASTTSLNNHALGSFARHKSNQSVKTSCKRLIQEQLTAKRKGAASAYQCMGVADRVLAEACKRRKEEKEKQRLEQATWVERHKEKQGKKKEKQAKKRSM